MKKISSFIAAMALFAYSAYGQPPDTKARYIAEKETSLSSAAEAVTVQQPTSGAKIVVFEGAWVYCSVACTFTLSQNGTAATTTTLATRRVNKSPASTAVAFSSSNVGAGTTLATYSVAAGATYPILLDTVWLDNNNVANNLTIATSSITGTARITIQYTER